MIRSGNGLPQHLSISFVERARNAFFSSYVSGFSKTYDVLDSLYQPESSNSHLSISVDAVSLAFFSFQYTSPITLYLAREQYSKALPLLNRALQSPQDVTTDTTLLAVLLLDLYEKFTSCNPRSTDSWMSHVNGALALVKLRDYGHLSDYARRRLSIRLTTNLTISIIAAKVPVPFGLVKLRRDLQPSISQDDPKWLISGLCLKYANLRATIKEGILSSDTIITRARKLDQEFVSVAEEMPSSWRYSTSCIDEMSDATLDNKYDSYPDRFITQTWNVLRVMRIFLQKIIQGCYIQAIGDSQRRPMAVGLSWSNGCCFVNDQANSRVRINSDQQVVDGFFHPSVLDCYGPSLADKTRIVVDTIDCMSREIYAAAPQYTNNRARHSHDQDLPSLRRLQCYTLLWPLYVAGLYSSAVSRIRPFVLQQLRSVADDCGIRNAAIVADTLESNEDMDPWDVYAMLGSYAFAA